MRKGKETGEGKRKQEKKKVKRYDVLRQRWISSQNNVMFPPYPFPFFIPFSFFYTDKSCILRFKWMFKQSILEVNDRSIEMWLLPLVFQRAQRKLFFFPLSLSFPFHIHLLFPSLSESINKMKWKGRKRLNSFPISTQWTSFPPPFPILSSLLSFAISSFSSPHPSLWIQLKRLPSKRRNVSFCAHF